MERSSPTAKTGDRNTEAPIFTSDITRGQRVTGAKRPNVTGRPDYCSRLARSPVCRGRMLQRHGHLSTALESKYGHPGSFGQNSKAQMYLKVESTLWKYELTWTENIFSAITLLSYNQWKCNNPINVTHLNSNKSTIVSQSYAPTFIFCVTPFHRKQGDATCMALSENFFTT